MSRYAGHVQILTATHAGTTRGVTITAACSVSDNPGTVLACVARENPLNAPFVQAGAFALNTLAARHQPLADVFSGLAGIDADQRFAHGDWDTMVTGAPCLVDAPAVYDCRLIEAREVATHLVLIGRVEGLRLGEPGRALLYLDRAYHQI
ncbi:flavin reductase family protein [Pseudohoeflea sp. DP4N28-3]|uniref:Flavin reductase family protein n=2 Tax=Pseudohoeflea coraliihabitans TaxID=2860393 RepID=A0ABS6WUY6_9HYPH|nr:flavin reductase family protein [Pseudohoeflea sp. DP4N28-3]MBW3098849.1 flavin reductase family protein [Pseudohoeflea sp. DP4N28-3]